MNIRILDIDDAHAYRDIRLRALHNDPESFGSTYEQESSRPLGAFIERIRHTKEQFTLGCFQDDDQLVGIVNFVRESRRKTAHKGNIYGMYMEPSLRGQGWGRALLSALIKQAIDGRIYQCVGKTIV